MPTCCVRFARYNLWIAEAPGKSYDFKGVIQETVEDSEYIVFRTDRGEFPFRNHNDPSHRCTFTAEDGSVATILPPSL